jgi:AmiR/NasT family two-component response regulator
MHRDEDHDAITIGRAQGILMESRNTDADEAMQYMLGIASNTDRSVSAVAEELVRAWTPAVPD